MKHDIYRVSLPASAFGEEVACLGSQLQSVLTTIRAVSPGKQWYYTDVEANCPTPFAAGAAVRPLGDFDAAIAALAVVDQLGRGVFLASAIPAPRFRSRAHTEDPEYADLGDADVEIRAFDASYFEVYSRDQRVADALSKAFRVDIHLQATT